MNASKLRKAVFRKPFVPLRLRLHAGEPVDVPHPEVIVVSDEWVAVGQKRKPPLIFEPEMVVSIEYPTHLPRSAAGGLS